jgi:hypothetical protein
MKKLNEFLTKNGSKIIIVLLVLIYFKSCGIDTELVRVKKELKIEHTNYVELKKVIKTLPTKIDIEVEGLKAEYRAISASDRKTFDLKRQAEIVKEINKLEIK